jgi:D-alanyl-lipoteichoic acid acyltransferase DltB (MBOAT superfamily)
LFVSYFPLLVAGPIERATHLLPQLKDKREFKYSQGVEGCRLILWGMFKKVVIADSLAPIVTDIFANYNNYNSITLILGLVGFAFQVYGDFSGYSDIARGVSKLFGIELIVNFNFPFFSKSIPEFWSRWHISLSLWLNDYVFTPLALNFRHYGKHGLFLAVFITFLLAGLWHGADWHFVFYGAYFGILYLPSIYGKKGIRSLVKKKSEDITYKDIPNILLTFTSVCLGFLLFRANNINEVIGFITRIINNIFYYPKQFFHVPDGKMVLVYVLPLFFLDFFFMRKQASLFDKIENRFLRYIFYLIIFNSIIVCNRFFETGNTPDFIYFQF